MKKQQRQAMVADQWRSLIQTQPLRDNFHLAHHPQYHPDIPPTNADDATWYNYATQAPLPAKRRREWEDGWTWHCGFGAACDPASMHNSH
eukprot:3103352-Rhodomonas_salina.1